MIELTHDVLCDPVVRSRDSRQEREAIARSERERREEEARRRKAEEEREKELVLRVKAEEATRIAELAESRARRALLVVGFLAVVCLLVGAFALSQLLKVNKTENQLKATTARAGFDLALFYGQSSGNEPRTLAYLAHALRIKPDTSLPRSYLVSLLRDKPWILPISEPMQHQGWVFSASFSSDGKLVVTASSDNTARVWDEFVDIESELPSWVPNLAEALGRQRFDENGFLVPAQKDLSTLRKELLALKGDDFWSRFGRWFATRGPERTISPNSTLTVGELERLKAEAETMQKSEVHSSNSY